MDAWRLHIGSSRKYVSEGLDQSPSIGCLGSRLSRLLSRLQNCLCFLCAYNIDLILKTVISYKHKEVLQLAWTAWQVQIEC